MRFFNYVCPSDLYNCFHPLFVHPLLFILQSFAYTTSTRYLCQRYTPFRKHVTRNRPFPTSSLNFLLKHISLIYYSKVIPRLDKSLERNVLFVQLIIFKAIHYVVTIVNVVESSRMQRDKTRSITRDLEPCQIYLNLDYTIN